MPAIQKSAAAPRLTVASKPRAAQPPVRNEADRALDSLKRDSFFTDRAPSAQAIKQAREALKALDGMRGIPLAQKDKAAWLTEAKALKAAASDALNTLHDAEWAKAGGVTDAEIDAAHDKLSEFSDTIVRAEERAGIRPLPQPLNPFGPLDRAFDGVMGSAGSGVLGAILAPILVPVAVMAQVVDVITRPIQVVVWPVAQVWRGLQMLGHKLGIG